MRRSSTPPTTLRSSISPPPSRNRKPQVLPEPTNPIDHIDTTRHVPPAQPTNSSSSAAIEAGHISLSPSSQLSYWVSHLSQHVRPEALLPISRFTGLYKQNEGSGKGAHFVIHQHDHPLAGLHYDLRLQINETSSVSWAIMYGMPGLPNGKRMNRNATETRVHCLWVGEFTFPSLLFWARGVFVWVGG